MAQNDQDGSDPFGDFINDSLNLDSLPQTVEDAEAEELRRKAIMSLFNLTVLQDHPVVNPITNEPWEGEFDEYAYSMLGNWPKIDAEKALSEMEHGTVTFEYFSKFVKLLELQIHRLRIPKAFIKAWYDSHPLKRYPWDLIKEYLEENDIVYITEGIEENDGYSELESDFDVFGLNPEVIEARRLFYAEIAGNEYNAKQFAEVLYRYFRFIRQGVDGNRRVLSLTEASNVVSLLSTSSSISRYQTSHFEKNMSDYLQVLIDNDLEEL